MSQSKPIGWPSVMPRIFTSDVAGLTAFLRTVFGAEGELRSGAPTEIRIGDSIILISDGGGVREAMPAFLYVYVENADHLRICLMATDERRSGIPGQTSGR